MNGNGIYLTLPFKSLAYGLLFVLLFSSCTKTTTDVAQVSSQDRSLSTYQSDLLTLVRAPNEPVRMEEIHLAESGDLFIDVRNVSSKTIVFAGYALSPIDNCPKSDHPLSFWIGYGDWNVLEKNVNPKIDPPILQNQKISMTISQKLYGDILRDQKLARCPDFVKPELTLYKVAFDDGTGWEGFADGTDHSEWNGRPWIPEAK